MDEPYLIGMVTDERPVMERLLSELDAVSCSPAPDGRADQVEKYVVTNGDRQLRRDSTLEQALSEIGNSRYGRIWLWTESGLEFTLSVVDPANEEEAWWGRASISFQTSEIDDRHTDPMVVEKRIYEIFNIVCHLIPDVEPEYVWSAIQNENEQYEYVKPTGRPIRDNVEDLSWITVMGPDVVEQFGGREHVLETPAHRIEELDSGHIALMLEDHPYKPSPEGHGHWKRHLLRD